MERTCKKCGKTKPIEEFKKRKACDYGYGHTCKSCVCKYFKDRYQKNKEKNKHQCKKYYEANKDHIKRKNALYYQENSERIKKQISKYRKSRIEFFKEYMKEYYQKNKKEIMVSKRGYDKEYRKSHSEYLKEYRRKLGKQNSEQINESYLIRVIYNRFRIPSFVLRQSPELIKSYRELLELKRKLKSKVA